MTERTEAMAENRKSSEEAIRAADEALRRDMRTINRAEELRARAMTRRIEDQFNRALQLNRNWPPRPRAS